MTSGRRAKAQRRHDHARRRREPQALPTWDGKPCDGMAFVIGWCQLNDLALVQARQRLHDQVIEASGDRRRGPVTWRWWSDTHAHSALSRFSLDPPSAEHAELYLKLRAQLYSSGGYIVVAACACEEQRAE